MVIVPPAVDSERFQPLRAESAPPVIASACGRMDCSSSASAGWSAQGHGCPHSSDGALAPDRPGLQAAIVGEGRDRTRLNRLIESTGAPVRLLGKVDDADLPAVYGCGDVFAMLCRSRWAGLEQEGFGIVFLEAAACGVPQVAGFSGERPRLSLTEKRGSWSTIRPTSTRRRTRSRRCSTTRGDESGWGGIPGSSGGRLRSGPAGWRAGRCARASPLTDPGLPDGRRIVQLSWAGTGVFAAVAIVAVFALDTLEALTVAVDLVLLAAGCVAFGVGFFVAVGRSRTEDITLPGLFALQGSAPAPCGGACLVPLRSRPPWGWSLRPPSRTRRSPSGC